MIFASKSILHMKFYKEKVAYYRQNPPLHQTPFGAAFEAGRLEREKENDALRARIAELEAELAAFPLLEESDDEVFQRKLLKLKTGLEAGKTIGEIEL